MICACLDWKEGAREREEEGKEEKTEAKRE